MIINAKKQTNNAALIVCIERHYLRSKNQTNNIVLLERSSRSVMEISHHLMI